MSEKSKKESSSSIKEKPTKRKPQKKQSKSNFSQFSNKVKAILNPDQIILKNQEQAKFFSFSRKFIGLYALFFIYSFVLLLAINDPSNIIISIFTFGDPFAIANALIIFFIILSLLYSNDKVRLFIFEGKTVLKQIGLYIGIIVPLFLLYTYVLGTLVNFTSLLLSLSMVWLFIYSSRFYVYSRKFSTKIESRIIKKYSVLRNFVVSISPIIILAILVFISWVYRALLVYLALDFLAIADPRGAVVVYYLEMRVIMPLIYMSLVITMVFVSIEYVFTRRRAETKRAGIFDNFTFSFIIFFIFFFQLMQMTVYLLLRPETVSSLKKVLGTTSSTASFIFFIEFGVSMFFLYRVLLKTGRSLGWQVIFFKQDGLILFMLATIFAQTTTRFSLSTNVPNQDITGFGLILLADKYIISVIMIIFLGATLLTYYLKPQQTSMFLRMEKETIDEEEKSMDIIYKLIRNEYIRRGEPFPLEILERQLIKNTKQSKAVVHSLIRRLAEKELDIELKRVPDGQGRLTLMIDFISVTEQFEKKTVARKKAQKFISNKLIQTTSGPRRKEMKLKSDLKSDKATDQFIASLSNDYAKKQKDEEILQKIREEEAIKTVKFKDGKIPDSLKHHIIDVIKKEYIFRIENPEKYSGYFIPISDISYQIQSTTRISPGDLYPLLEQISRKDLEINLAPNPENKEDKLVKFYPIASDTINYALESFRPEDYSGIRIRVCKNFIKCLKKAPSKKTLSSLSKSIGKIREDQKAWGEILSLLYKEFPKIENELKRIPKYSLFTKHFNLYLNKLEKHKIE